jgi:hypothetical protein
MNKLQTEVQTLLRYEYGDRDTKILEALLDKGTQGKAAKETGIPKRTLQRRLAAIRKQAQQYGYHEEFPEASTVLDQPIRGKSRLQRFDPPLPDGTILEWKKTKFEDAVTIDSLKAISEGLSVPAIPASAYVHTRKETEKLLSMLAVADAHLGILSQTRDEKWGLDDNVKMLKDLIVRHIDRMQPVETAILNNLGDLTHTDGLVAQTPKNKNPLDADSLYFPICTAAGELLAFTIEGLMTKAKKVIVKNNRGNHDLITAWHINEKMKERYRNNKRVQVLDNDEYHIPFVWENNFILSTHGDASSNQMVYNMVTQEYPHEWAAAAYVHVCKGHIHHETEQDIGKAKFQTFTSTTKKDDYHKFKNYCARRAMSMIHYHPEGGEDGRSTLRPRG